MANLTYNRCCVHVTNRYDKLCYGGLRKMCVKEFLGKYVQPERFYIFEDNVIRKPSEKVDTLKTTIVLADGKNRHIFIVEILEKVWKFRSFLLNKGTPILERLFSGWSFFSTELLKSASVGRLRSGQPQRF